jgi:hypothetical protein
VITWWGRWRVLVMAITVFLGVTILFALAVYLANTGKWVSALTPPAPIAFVVVPFYGMAVPRP